MTRTLIPLGLVCWTGAALVLSERRWFARRSLAARIQPYVPGGWRREGAAGVLSAASFREVVAPFATLVGEAVARVVGVHEPLATRLARVHRTDDPTSVRIRQLGIAAVALIGAGAVAAALAVPAAVATVLILAAPLLAFLVLEQQITERSSAWKRRLFLELPIVAEQLAMLLGAGYSLGGALDRVSRRGTGATAQDLARVGRRVRQGLSEAEALREWADLADVPAVHRLVSVLCLNRETGDLGRLIAEEARTVRKENQRQLVVQIERRAQQVWIPVTVATLVPGTLLLAVPFLQAVQLFAR